MAFAREIEVARKAAEEAAKLALKYQAAGIRPDTKPDDSPVTIADRESERLISSRLEEAFPEDGVLGEEGAHKQSRSGRRWIIDPIDGTRDFVRGNLLWSVLIGLEQDAEVVAGVVHLPMLQQTCWASRGDGAFCNDTRLRVSSIADPSKAVLSVNSLNRIRDMRISRGLIDWASQFWAYRCLGGTPDAMMVAAGQVDVWIEPKVAAWDLAAVQVVLEEAGAVFSDFSGARTIYGGSAVACTPGLEQEVRAFLDRK
jgi:histidinol-phosphatase